jgi:hypothetical protein
MEEVDWQSIGFSSQSFSLCYSEEFLAVFLVQKHITSTYRQALTISQEKLGSDHPRTKRLRANIEETLEEN